MSYAMNVHVNAAALLEMRVQREPLCEAVCHKLAVPKTRVATDPPNGAPRTAITQ
jgi:hypothetical protein